MQECAGRDGQAIRSAEGLALGVDWNNGTQAKLHGHRASLIDALPAARDALNRLQDQAAPPAAPQVNEAWQPIETAPRDEDVYILAMRAGAKVPFIASYDADFDNWYTFNGALENCNQKFEPTHWQPLPEPPALNPIGEEGAREPW
jgi:hypothetical protein